MQIKQLRQKVIEISKISDEGWMSTLNERKIKEFEFHNEWYDKKRMSTMDEDSFEKYYSNEKFYDTVSESNIYIDERDRRSATKKEYTLTINKDKRVCVQIGLEPFADTGIGHHLNKLEQEEHKEFILQRLDIEGL